MVISCRSISGPGDQGKVLSDSDYTIDCYATLHVGSSALEQVPVMKKSLRIYEANETDYIYFDWDGTTILSNQCDKYQ